ELPFGETGPIFQFLDRSLDFGKNDSVFLDPLIERAAGNTESVGGPVDVSVLGLKSFSNQDLLCLEKREVRKISGLFHGSRAETARENKAKVIRIENVFARRERGPFQSVAKLSNVARPGVPAESLYSGGRQVHRCAIDLRADFAKQKISESGN